MTDLHIHTNFSFDSDEPMESYVRRAVARGDGALGFSEHCDYDAVLDGEAQHPLPDWKAYFSEIERLANLYPQIGILKGVELGYRADALPYYRALWKEYDFDYAVMSVHTLKGRGDCYYPAFYRGWDKKRAYSEYLRAVLESVRADADFQIVGHIGYVARYAPYEEKRLAYEEFAEEIDEILRAIIARGLCLELNTSARGTGTAFVTDRTILERYIQLGGTNFSYGSDAHSAERYRDGARAVREFLSAHGVGEICRFDHGKPIKEKV